MIDCARCDELLEANREAATAYARALERVSKTKGTSDYIKALDASVEAQHALQVSKLALKEHKAAHD